MNSHICKVIQIFIDKFLFLLRFKEDLKESYQLWPKESLLLSYAVEGNEDTSIQQSRQNVQPGATTAPHPPDYITKADLKVLMMELLDCYRQLNQQIQANIELMDKLKDQRGKPRRELTPYSGSESSSSFDNYHRSKQCKANACDAEKSWGNYTIDYHQTAWIVAEPPQEIGIGPSKKKGNLPAVGGANSECTTTN